MGWEWLLIAPVGLLYLGLLVFALTDWARRHRTRHLNRWLWLPIVVIFSIVGPVAYLILGRESSPHEGSIKCDTEPK